MEATLDTLQLSPFTNAVYRCVIRALHYLEMSWMCSVSAVLEFTHISVLGNAVGNHLTVVLDENIGCHHESEKLLIVTGAV